MLRYTIQHATNIATPTSALTASNFGTQVPPRLREALDKPLPLEQFSLFHTGVFLRHQVFILNNLPDTPSSCSLTMISSAANTVVSLSARDGKSESISVMIGCNPSSAC